MDMGHTIATDSELLDASRRGEREAFGALVERYQNIVCAVTYSRTRNQALSEDVAQDTFIAAWRRLDQLRDPGRLRAWLCGIARNLASKARRRSDREAAPLEEPIATGENPFDAVCQAQAEQVVGDALSRVPAIYRDALVLYYREQRSARDVAAALGISEAAVLQRLARGRQHLADGVTALVEQSLRAQRKPRRALIAGVLAALPMTIPSRVEAATALHGGSAMLKLTLAVTALAAAGTTAYVVYPAGDPQSSARTTAAPVQTVAATPAAIPPRGGKIPFAPPAGEPAGASRGGKIDGQPCGDCDEKDGKKVVLDDPPEVSRETIARLGLEQGPTRGAAKAPVTIVAFTDMLCKFCGSAIGAVDQLLEEYPGKVRIVMKAMPVHAPADPLARGLYAAEAQGKYWELHDLMIANQDDLSKDASRDSMIALARQAGLDVGKFSRALEQPEQKARLDAEKAAAAELGVKGVPAFFVNGKPLIGMRSIAEFRAAIDSALAAR